MEASPRTGPGTGNGLDPPRTCLKGVLTCMGHFSFFSLIPCFFPLACLRTRRPSSKSLARSHFKHRKKKIFNIQSSFLLYLAFSIIESQIHSWCHAFSFFFFVMLSTRHDLLSSTDDDDDDDDAFDWSTLFPAGRSSPNDKLVLVPSSLGTKTNLSKGPQGAPLQLFS